MRLPPLRVIIFGLIGLFNTLFDLLLYVLVYNATKSIVFANVVSTSAALIGSYLLNARVTFKTKRWTAGTFALFVIVTVFGLWVLQTGVIYAITPGLRHLPDGVFTWLGPLASTARTLLPKVLATSVTLVWNYVWYSKVIFKELPKHAQETLAADTL